MIASQLWLSAYRRAASAIRRRSSGRSISESRASARRSGGSDGSTRMPVSPGRTVSPTPPARRATTGRPEAIASSTTLPKVSVRLENAKMSAAA